MLRVTIFVTFFYLLLTGCNNPELLIIDLSGEWQFRIDTSDQGVEEEWYSSGFEEKISLPGSLASNGKGYDITMETKWTGGIAVPDWEKKPEYAPFHDPENVRYPFWLQPVKKYTGAAWFIKEVDVPEEWNNKTIQLKLERPHWESSVWINGQYSGSQNSLAVPHVFDISPFIKPGHNSIALRIDNRVKNVDVGINSHSMSDHTQSNWNGVVGEISLTAKGKIKFDDVQVFPNVSDRALRILARISSSFDENREITVNARALLRGADTRTPKKSWKIQLSPGANTVELIYNMGEDALLWDEFDPNVYELRLGLRSKQEEDDYFVDVGLREFRSDGSRFTINGRPVFLRGTLECAIFPLTGYPPTGPEYWRKIYTAVKDHGLNHVRFHSWCPPEAAFDAADEMGIYLQVECSSWANQSTRLGSGLPVDQYIQEESHRIVEEYGNHPSFVMMAYGNEPGGLGQKGFLKEFVKYWKDEDPRRQYTSAAGWPAIPENDFHNLPGPRIQGWGEELSSILNAEAPNTSYDWTNKLPGDGIPMVSHEIGQWCVYPRFKEIEKYTGVLKPRNFELFRESLEARQLMHLADSFVMASGKLQALCYKADIEAALRTPGFAGFQLLDLHDFPGQGTALVGILDPFWEEKGYISPEQYRQFCNSTVPLARLDKRVFLEGETLIADVEVAHFGSAELSAIIPEWELTENGKIIVSGKLEQVDVPVGNGINLGRVSYDFEVNDNPRKLTFIVRLGDFKNSWDLWVYPDEQMVKDVDIKIVEELDPATMEYLEDGGKVLLSLGKGRVAPYLGGNIGVGFSSIFWNTAWTGKQKPHTLGILCDPDHPALEMFPTEYHSNWQWWDAMSQADAIRLDMLNKEIDPIVRIIDDWVSNRSLALIFEAKVSRGKIIVCGADLNRELDSRPEARQLRYSLFNYMSGCDFNPEAELDPSVLQSIVQR